MSNQVFDPSKYGMTRCAHCCSTGYLHNPQKYPCPVCRGFGYLKDESAEFVSRKPQPNPLATAPTR
jgi:RecJ-like exonuclease